MSIIVGREQELQDVLDYIDDLLTDCDDPPPGSEAEKTSLELRKLVCCALRPLRAQLAAGTHR